MSVADPPAVTGPRVLHAGHMRVVAPGPARQMEQEQQVATALGLPWRAAFYCPPGVESDVCVHPPTIGGRSEFKRGYYDWLGERLGDFDLLFLRYATADPAQLAFLRRCPVPVVTGHHTLEVHELSTDPRFRARLLVAAERVVGPLSLARARAHVGVTDEIARYASGRALGRRAPAIRYPNGVSYEAGEVITAALSGDRHELLFVSSQFAPWAGLDLLLDAASRSDRQFVVHVVGRLDDAQRARLEGDPRFVAHGFLDPSEIAALTARSTIGLGALALHRNRMTEGSTLKVRAYLRAGLAVYSGYRDVFDESFPYYRHGDVNLTAILAFADAMADVDREEIAARARPLIDKRALLEALYAELSALPGG